MTTARQSEPPSASHRARSAAFTPQSGEHTRPRVSPDAPSHPASGAGRELVELQTISSPPGFPRGRGKPHPGAGALPIPGTRSAAFTPQSGEHARPRVLPAAPSQPASGAVRELVELRTIFSPTGFPRGRGKLHPRAGALPIWGTRHAAFTPRQPNHRGWPQRTQRNAKRESGLPDGPAAISPVMMGSAFCRLCVSLRSLRPFHSGIRVPVGFGPCPARGSGGTREDADAPGTSTATSRLRESGDQSPDSRAVFANVRAVRTLPSVSLSAVWNGGEGRGEEALRHAENIRSIGAPLSPTLSPFVPHGARETDALFVAAAFAHMFATMDTAPDRNLVPAIPGRTRAFPTLHLDTAYEN